MAEFTRIGNYTIAKRSNVEFCNPIEFEFSGVYDSCVNVDILLAELRAPHVDRLSLHNYSVRKFLMLWRKLYRKAIRYKFEDDFFSFLECGKKKQQEAILKTIKLSTTSLQAIIFRAYKQYGFLYSFYSFERPSKTSKNKVMPAIAYLQSDKSIDKVGYTDMSDKEIKTNIEQRNVVIAKFLDKGRYWHCFLYTMKSITGAELGQAPHIHYISSAFGNNITREFVLSELSKGKYNLPSMLHIDFDKEITSISMPIINSGQAKTGDIYNLNGANIANE